LQKSGVDLKKRMDEGKLLDLSEFENLSAICRVPLDKIHGQVENDQE
jgi:hypothetical protein